MRRAARRDDNEGDIVAAARRCGLKVFPINDAGIGDLIVQWGSVCEVWEVKREDGKLTDAQCKLRQQGLRAHIIRNVDDVLLARKRIISLCHTPPTS